MFKCFSIRESDGGFIKARIPTSSKETVVEPMPVLRLPSPTIEEKGRRIGGVDGGSRFLLEGDSVCREGRIFWAMVREKTRGRRATKGRDRRTQAGLRKGEEGSWKIVGEKEMHERCFSVCENVYVYVCVLKSVRARVTDRERWR